MASYSKVQLSGGVNGRPIPVAATATPGTTIHTASTTSSVIDELHLYAVNSDTSDHKLTIEWGGVTSPDDLIEITIPAESGLILVIPGLCLDNALVCKAFAASASKINIVVHVNRITA